MSNALLQSAGVWLAWLGFAVLVFALFFNRVRRLWKKHRRCPKCWYDMSHTPGLTCSECGKTVKRERSLRKAKPRRKLAIVAVFILLLGYAGQVTPGVKARGWAAAVPTPVLLCAVPWLEVDSWAVTFPGKTGFTRRDDIVARELACRLTNIRWGNVGAFSDRRAPLTSRASYRVAAWLLPGELAPNGERYVFDDPVGWLAHRVKSVRGERWHAEDSRGPYYGWFPEYELAVRSHRGPNDPVHVFCRMRAIDFRDPQPHLQFRPVASDAAGFMPRRVGAGATFGSVLYPGHSDLIDEDIHVVAQPTEHARVIEYDVEYWSTDRRFFGGIGAERRWRVETRRVSIKVPASVDASDAMRPSTERTMQSLMHDALLQVSTRGHPVLHLWSKHEIRKDELEATFIAGTVELLANDRVVAKAKLLKVPERISKSTSDGSHGLWTNGFSGVHLKPVDGVSLPRLFEDPAYTWTCRIRGDRDLALFDFNAKYYVAGEVTLPVELVP
ncbi:MAG: hypothetical protein AAF432_06950 [Planctomycetota bacterium]